MSTNEINPDQEKKLRHKLSLYAQMVEIYPSDAKYLHRMIELLLMLGDERHALEKMRKLEQLYKKEGNHEGANDLRNLRRNISTQSQNLDSTFHPFLSDLTPEVLNMLMKDSKRVRFREGETLIKQGDQDNRVFIVLDGELAVLVHYTEERPPAMIHSLGEGSIVGETAFLEGSSRSATVVANQNSTVLELNHKRVLQCLLQHPEVGEALASESLKRRQLTAINSNRFLAKLDSVTKERLAADAEIISYKPFEVLATAHSKLEWVGIVISGLIRCIAEDRMGNSHILHPLKPGYTIGDLEALNESNAMCDMVAVHQSDVLQIPVETFLDVMEHNPAIKTRILEISSGRISNTVRMLMTQTGKVT